MSENETYWWCPECKEEVTSNMVTIQELHEKCGCRVETKTWVDENTQLRQRVAELEKENTKLEGLLRVETDECDIRKKRIRELEAEKGKE